MRRTGRYLEKLAVMGDDLDDMANLTQADVRPLRMAPDDERRLLSAARRLLVRHRSRRSHA